jgi:hypothetical protein
MPVDYYFLGKIRLKGLFVSAVDLAGFFRGVGRRMTFHLTPL